MFSRLKNSCPFLAFAATLAVAGTSYGQYWGGPVEYRSSTIGESYARGAADLVRSSGAANLMNSAAALNLQDAYTKDLQNRTLATETYFHNRELNRQYRAAENPKPTTEQLFRIAKESAPNELSPSQLDPLTGQISWPLALTDDVFATSRMQVEELASTRAANSGRINFSQYQQMKGAISYMQSELKANIQKFPPQAYSQAKAFLKSLDYELDQRST